MVIELVIATPEQKIFTGAVCSVRLPSVEGLFEIFPDHAPIISLLEKGRITYRTKNSSQSLDIDGGLALVRENKVTVLI